ncbi:hypothetical protein ACFL1S_05520 [Pseudomonadota bacterium]
MPQYSIFGLSLHSEIDFPELKPGNSEPPDFTVSVGKLPHSLKHIRDRGICYQVNEEQVMLSVDTVGSILIHNGRTVIVDPDPSYDRDLLRLVLLNNVPGVILHQRKYSVFQACAVIINNRCYAFAGATGSGKSTLMAAFQKLGFQVVTDDVCALKMADNAQPKVLVGYPFIQIWRKTQLSLKIDRRRCKRVRSGLEKFFMPIAPPTVNPELHYICLLKRSRHYDEIKLTQLGPADSLTALITCTFQQQFMKGMGLLPFQLPSYSAICNSVPTYRLSIPSSFTIFDSLIDRITQIE